jgi:hypothetical protein
VIALSWWQPYSVAFPILTDRMRALQIPDWSAGTAMNGHHVTVTGVFHEQYGPWPDMTTIDDSAPARGIFVGPVHMRFASASDAMVRSTPLTACPGPVEPVYVPQGPPRSAER